MPETQPVGFYYLNTPRQPDGSSGVWPRRFERRAGAIFLVLRPAKVHWSTANGEVLAHRPPSLEQVQIDDLAPYNRGDDDHPVTSVLRLIAEIREGYGDITRMPMGYRTLALARAQIHADCW